METIRKEISEMKDCIGAIVVNMASSSLSRAKLLELVKRINKASIRLIKYLEG